MGAADSTRRPRRPGRDQRRRRQGQSPASRRARRYCCSSTVQAPAQPRSGSRAAAPGVPTAARARASCPGVRRQRQTGPAPCPAREGRAKGKGKFASAPVIIVIPRRLRLLSLGWAAAHVTAVTWRERRIAGFVRLRRTVVHRPGIQVQGLSSGARPRACRRHGFQGVIVTHSAAPETRRWPQSNR